MDKSRIAAFLASGLPPTQVASIVGCSPAYIVQLSKDTDFQETYYAEAVAAQPKETNEDKILTNKYLAAEHKILDSMQAAFATAELPALTRALEVVSNRQEKRAQRLLPPAATNLQQVNILQLTLPAHAIPEYTLNSQSEVIAIGDKTMNPLPSAAVKNLFSTLREGAANKAAEELGFTQELKQA